MVRFTKNGVFCKFLEKNLHLILNKKGGKKVKLSLRFFIISMLVMMICCVSAVSATDINGTDVVSDDIIVDEVANNIEDVENELTDVEGINLADDVNNLDLNDFNDNLEDGASDSLVIYVNQNQSGDGEGSYDNPFKDLDLACQNINGEDNVTIFISSGTYEMGDNLNFDVDNLNICGIGGEVVIKNKYNKASTGYDFKGEAFKLTSSSANLTVSNLTFDSSGFNSPIVGVLGGGARLNFFVPFYGNANLVTFNNCTFKSKYAFCNFCKNSS